MSFFGVSKIGENQRDKKNAKNEIYRAFAKYGSHRRKFTRNLLLNFLNQCKLRCKCHFLEFWSCSFRIARFSQWFESVSGSVVAILGSVGAISGFEIAILGRFSIISNIFPPNVLKWFCFFIGPFSAIFTIFGNLVDHIMTMDLE